MNNINFGMDGLSLDGTTWWNAKTGDTIKIRNNYFEDNAMKIQTTDGRILSLDQLSSYVQWTGKGTPPKPEPQTPKKTQINELPIEVANLINNTEDNGSEFILEDDLNLINGNIQNINKGPVDNYITSQKTSQKIPNYDIINRALSKTEDPDWSLVMKWPKFPAKELDMLTTVMDVPMDEITSYYIGKIQDEFDDFIKGIKDQLSDYITNKLYPTDSNPVETKKKTTKSKK